MKAKTPDLAKIQQLVLAVRKVERNHNILDSDEHENVIDHSFAVAMLCWKLYDLFKPNLSLEKVLKYCLAHDFLERGLAKDINTYADTAARDMKKEREQMELKGLSQEFNDFDDMLQTLKDYEDKIDDEARYVWVVDKMQAVVLGDMDDWRPYRRANISYQQFYDKGEEFLEKCPDSLKDTLIELNTYSRKTYYDQPEQT